MLVFYKMMGGHKAFEKGSVNKYLSKITKDYCYKKPSV
ncbi:hypothetical protein ADICYQ_4834 [Cyclobacterium qasimii M12-11B]|uniref:Uncharacterized protein n=1 Tax=Cyclobacterium qasimii M12-11B TaxID=641524 RepID=S7V896_9BACT|nr:hypothetical protein ADICYQ_4834 [Cyclobacterium qasimii M12-11B]